MIKISKRVTAGAVLAALLAVPFAASADHRDDRNDRHRAEERHERQERYETRRRVSRADFAPFGARVQRLPEGHVHLSFGFGSYYYFGGNYYRWANPGYYVVVRAPIGARVGFLPPGYVAFTIGPRRYFYANSSYYLWDPAIREYVVVPEPAGAATAIGSQNGQTEESSASADAGELYAYPDKGQSEAQAKRDRYECHLWASDQSGYDPTYPDQQTAKRDDYRRAMTACLVGRGYTVR